jgi:RHS repeat-associated protein
MDGLTIKSSEDYIRQVYELAWRVQGVGDFDGDGKADIYWRRGEGSAGSQEYVYLGDIPVAVFTGDSGSTANYVHADHLNTPRLVANAAGTPVWLWDQSEPFGNNVANENPSGLGTFEFVLRFPGQYFDRETFLYYNYFRDYDPSLGRYVQSDPIGLEGGLNTYAYVGGNPISSTDSLGLIVNVSGLAGGRSSKSSGKSTNCGPAGCQQSFTDCFDKCLEDRLGDLQSIAQTLVLLGAANAVALSAASFSVGGISITGPALQVFTGLGGRAIGAAIGGAAGRALGGAMGAFGGRLAIYALITAGAAASGYVVGSIGYCSVACANDHCYY